MDGAAEVIEGEALSTSPLVGKPLRELDFLDGMRVGAIYRAGKVVFPNGDLEIEERDRVVIFTLAERVRQVEQMFRVSLEFF
jgi:trk system potassium uptake protein TrkA